MSVIVTEPKTHAFQYRRSIPQFRVSNPPKLSVQFHMLTTAVPTVLALFFFQFQGQAQPPKHNTDDLFGTSAIPHIQIEVPPEGMEILGHYDFDINNLMERTNVLATIREGKAVYTNVALHLKGHLGSFRPVDSKPAFTLNFDKNADGQRFHGLQKLHLNNSVQDYSYVSEQISRELFLKA